MRRKLLLSGALLALTATPASAASLDLAWSACPTFGGTQNVNFDCVHDVPVWHMEMNQRDCNGGYDYRGGFALSAYKPGTGCGTGSQVISTWNTENTVSGQGYLDAGRPTVPPGANRARILCTISRAATLPIRLNPTNKYYGFSIYFSMENASENGVGTCDGCPIPACIVWNSTTLIRTTREPYLLEGPGLVSNAAAINGGSSSCLATPIRSKTWGQIKALYR